MFGMFLNNQTPFVAQYRCYPLSFVDKGQYENGDKTSLRIEYPMLFEISNLREQKVSHCGVIEFSAEEGMANLPYWEGDIVQLKSTSLPKANFVKLRPQSKDFLDISNPRAVLEKTLRAYTCLTTGDSILINYNNKRFYLDIMETKPGPAVSVFETDCNVDFAPPLDYVEPVWVPPAAAAAAAAAAAPAKAGAAASAAPAAPEPPKFTAFQGVAKRLDGKPACVQPAEPPPPPAAVPSGGGASSAAAASSSSAAGAGAKKAGKLVFGGAQSAAAGAPRGKPVAPMLAPAPPPEEPKFVPFQGKARTLKD